MQILRSIPDLAGLRAPIVLAIGVFDGLHLGHQEVIGQALRDAKMFGAHAVVLTFDPHPARVLRPDKAPRLLTATEHKVRLIRSLGVECLLLIRFDAGFAAMPPEDFIKGLADAARPLHGICVGHQWVFGRERSGDVALIERLGAEIGFRVNEVPSVKVDGETVSSTRIRMAIEEGDFETAWRCLGREYAILGTVEKGRQLGRAIGFRTANLRAHSEQFPPDGVYAVRALLDGRMLPGVANIGVRPTFDSAAERTLEVHLFDFDADIYDLDMEITFAGFLRPEQRFATIEDLKVQIERDAKAAKKLLGHRR